MPQPLETYFALCLLLTLTPGADTALVLRSAIAGGTRAYFPTILGICAGLLVHAGMSSLGLSVVLQESAALYSAVKMLGAAYLLYLGLRALVDAWKINSSERSLSKGTVSASKGPWAGFRNGLVTNVLNPKCAVFYLTFLPQFVDVRGNVFVQSILLALVHVLFGFVWLWIVGAFVSYFGKQLSKPSVRKTLDALTGFAFIGFGIRLVTSRD